MDSAINPEELSALSSTSDFSTLSETTENLSASSQITLISTEGSAAIAEDLREEISENIIQKPAQMKLVTEYSFGQQLRMQAQQMAKYLRNRTGNDASGELTQDPECSDDHSTKNTDDLLPKSKSTILEQNETTDCSETIESGDLDNEQTRELLKHYLENSDSVDALKIYKLEPLNYLKQIVTHIMEVFNFMVLICSSKQFWNTALVIANILAAVFFYLVLAVSTIIVTLILNVHDALEANEDDRDKNAKKEEMQMQKLPPNIDELSL